MLPHQGRPWGRVIRIAGAVSLALLTSSRAGAISSRTLFTPTGAAANDLLGVSVASAGDVNGDGFADVIVGAMLNDAGGTNAGRAYAYYGGPGADATADLTLTGEAAGDQLGYAVASAGDINGDGFADLVVGAFRNDAGGSDAGRAYVYYGGPAADATADLTLTGAAAGDFFGYSAASAGDVNGDGFADLIVGALHAGGTGRAYLYYGGPAADATADLTLTGAAASDWFGHSVASAGDVNGDGFTDMIVGAILSDAGGTDTGGAFVYYGGPAADANADLTLTGEAVDDRFGVSVASAGDVNGDGYADLIVGAYSNDAGGTFAGRAYVYHGGPSADAIADLILTGAPGDDLGYSVAAADVNNDGFADLIAGADGDYVGGAGRTYIYFGGAGADATADLVLNGAAADDAFGYSVAAAGDVDGDGFTDLIVGADGNDGAGNNAGRAYVTAIYPYQVLSPNGGEQWVAGRPATVRWIGHDVADLAISFDGGASWSTLLSGVGGQEQNEVTVIAPTIPTSGARVRLSYSGQPVSRSTSDMSDGVFRIVPPAPPPAAALMFQSAAIGNAAFDFYGYSAASAGDVNGDGFADLIVGAPFAGAGDEGQAYICYGGPGADLVAELTLTGAAPGDQLGISVSGAGDVNGDGYADLIVGASLNDAGGADAGAAHVYYGGPTADATADLTLTGEAAGDQFGISVSGAGDVNGDGYADVIVGGLSNDGGGTDAGRAYVFLGGPTADAVADLVATGVAAGDQLGVSVAGAGDLNGDGFADVIAGACFNDAGGADAGRAYVYFGGGAPDVVPDLILTGAAAGDQFGASVAGAGDVNGDDFADVIVGASFNDAGGADAGRAYVYYGGSAADATADVTFKGAAPGDEFGYRVSGGGDVNRDGLADLIIGAPKNDAGGINAGQAYVYLGGVVPDATADFTLTGGLGDQFGASVAGTGDINGDGFGDLMVGAPISSSLFLNAGLAYLYVCNRYFVVSPNDDEVWNVGAAQSISWVGAERADLWLSTNGGATYELLRHDVGGSANNAVSLLVPHAPTRFARVRVTPVDAGLSGADESDSTFTIQSSVALLAFTAESGAEGAELSWSTEPGVGPGGLAGYRLYRLGPSESGNGARIGPELITESRYRDPGGTPGNVYRLTAVNGLRGELELGRVGIASQAPLAAWPLPYRGGVLNVSFGVSGQFGSKEGEAAVELFDLGGRHVKTLARGRFAAGHRTVLWDGRDERGAPVGNGIYFLRATSAGTSRQLKLAVVR